MATIRERKGNQQVLFRLPNGKQTSETFNFNHYYYTKKDKDGKDIKNSDNQAKKEALKAAEKFSKEIEAEKTLGLAKDKNNIKFGKYAIDFMEIHTEDLKGTTIHNYETCGYIRSVITSLYGQVVSDKVRIQYGGSVKPSNIKELMSQPHIDGALIGGASLDADAFIEMTNFKK